MLQVHTSLRTYEQEGKGCTLAYEYANHREFMRWFITKKGKPRKSRWRPFPVSSMFIYINTTETFY